MNFKDKNNQTPPKKDFPPINPNLHSSAALARERFKRALPLNPAKLPEEEMLREALTEHEET